MLTGGLTVLKNKWYNAKVLPKGVSFEWSHHRILSKDSKVRTINYMSIIYSGKERGNDQTRLTKRNSHQISRNLNLPSRTKFQNAMDISKSANKDNLSVES